ncbi:MAG: PAS domain S-box protein [Nitrospirae bacterium]|nr:PAS domain S-box protein [Nitrospirota bacterium]
MLTSHTLTNVEIAAVLLALIVIVVIVRNFRLKHTVNICSRDLARMHEWNRLILDSAGEGIYGTNTEGTAVFVNPAAAGMLGWDADELLGRNMHDVIHHTKHDGTSYPAEACAIYAAFREGIAYRSEDEILWRKDGSSFRVGLISTPLRDKNGAIIGSVVAFNDISARITSERIIQEQISFSQALNSLAEAIIMNDEQNVILDEMARIVGETLHVDRTLIYDMSFKRRRAIGLSEWMNPDCTDIVATKSTYPLKFFIGGATEMMRTRHWIESHVDAVNPVAVEDGSGVLLHKKMNIQSGLWYPFAFHDCGYYLIALNQVHSRRVWQKEEIAFLDSVVRLVSIAFEKIRLLNERRLSQDNILQARNEWVETFDTINDAITIHDKDFNIIRSNRAAEQLLGIPGQDIIKRKCHESFHCSDCPAEGCPGMQSMETGLPAFMERFEPTLGKYIEVRTVPRFNAENRIIGFLHVVRDITERKQLEEQLRQSQKMEAVGRLAGGIAHDFNNILTAIIGYGSIMQMNMTTAHPLRMHADQIIEAANRAAELTHSLLAFSRKQILNPKPVDLNDIVRGLVKFLTRIMGEDVEIITSAKHEGIIANADRGQIEQVLMNCATNARDAMPNGGIFTIETDTVSLDAEYVRMHGVGKAGAYAVMSVSDNGTGMGEEIRKHLFEPFFTTKEIGKGTGLGLSIIYGIIRQHNGFINVHSEPGRGTTFKIYLPIEQSVIERTTASAVPASPPGGTETILLAEDDDTVRELSRTVLTASGYTVITAMDGEDAISKFTEHKGDIKLVILDMIMPKKTGKQAYDELRSMKPGIRVLFVSGYTADMIHRDGMLIQDIDLISKPVSPTELLKKVRNVLDKGDDVKPGN